MNADQEQRHRRRRTRDLLNFIARHPGCTVAEANAAHRDRPRFFADLNVELIHELYLDGRLILGSARSGATRLTARAAPTGRGLLPGPTRDLPAPSMDVTAELAHLVA